MKKTYFYLRRCLAGCFILSVILMLTSCNKDVEGYAYTDEGYKNINPTAIVIILGNHANAMAIPDDAYNVIDEALERAVYGGYVCAIVSDATPTKFELVEDETFFEEDAENDTVLKQRIEERKETIIDSLRNQNVSADSPEVDLLSAIREAKNVLASSRFNNVNDKQIFIIDTGISTSGDLSFVDMKFLYNKPDISELIKKLQDYEGMGVFPDLTGITVTFIGTADGLAEVAEPQKVSVTDQKFIKDLWTKVVEASGASDIRFESVAGWVTPNIYTEDTESQFPYVSVITFMHEKILDFSAMSDYDPNNPDPQPLLPDPPKVSVKLESETIGFISNEANYFNEANAKNTLEPYADELKEFFKYYPDERIWLVGTSATTKKGGEGDVNLSMDRAQKVKSTLVTEFGVPEENLLTVGLGARFPWYVDAFSNGNFDTEVAQVNRAVWILTKDSDRFKELKSAYDNGELLPESSKKFSSLYR